MAKWSLTDQYGRPISRDVLTQETAGPSITGVRQPQGGYPADGLTPDRLAAILKAADQGNPYDYYDLAELTEERNLHYLAVLGTRKRVIAQTPIRVEAASDDPLHVKHADMVRDWLTGGVLREALFDILDAVGKGISYNEIVWDTSEGQWQPARIIWRPQRWFAFDRADMETPLLREVNGDTPLPPAKFIIPRIKAKSGLTVRSGIARAAIFAWMMKAYADRDWAIFTQTYGQPLRLGKYPSGATDDAKRTLMRAVANIAADCAAIVEQGTDITFVETKAGDKSAANYQDRIKHLNEEVSKAVLGQSGTTDAIAGGYAVGRVHREVQKDIADADRMALAAVLTQQLVRPWIDLEHGPQKLYPRIVVEEPDQTDIATMATALGTLVPLGLKVSMAEVRDKLGLADPAPDEVVLTAPAAREIARQITPPGALPQPAPPPGRATAALHSAEAQAEADMPERIAAAAETLAQPALDEMIGAVRRLLDEAATLEDVRDGLLTLYPQMNEQGLADAMRLALAFAELAGMDDGNTDA